MIASLSFFLNHPRALSSGIIFSSSSILFGSWVTQLPNVKEKLMLSEGEIGIALFFAPVGSMLMMPFCNYLIKRWGEGRISIYSTILLSLAMIYPIIAPNLWFLSAGMFVVGIAGGLMGVGVNAVVSILEKKEQIRIMSTCHGFYSLGGVLGASIGSIVVGLGVSPILHLSIAAIIVLVITLTYVRQNIEPIYSENKKVSKSTFSIPPKAVWGIAFIGFCIMIGEGAVADWSAIYLKDLIQKPSFITGLGYAGFSFCMTFGRFYGDQISHKIGSLRIIQYGSLIALIGISCVILGNPPIAVLGFSMIGLGYSCIVPVVYSFASNIKGIDPSQSIATVASIAYVGFVIGPVSIGFIADYYGLQLGFLLLIILTVTAFILARSVFRKE